MATKHIKVSTYLAMAREKGVRPTMAQVYDLDSRLAKIVDEDIARLAAQHLASKTEEVTVTITPIVKEVPVEATIESR